MKKKLAATDVCALLMGLVGLIIFLLIWQGNKALVENLTQEDALIENLSAFFWLEASVICSYRIATSSQKSKLLLYFWACFCFVCFNEEISWGQRIFGYSIKFIEDASIQHEVSLHTLSCFCGKKLGLLEALKSGNWNWSNINLWALLAPQKLFYLGFLIYFLIIPLIVRFGKFKTLVGRIHYNLPGFYYLISIWSNIILFWILAKISDRGRSITETGEMFIAFAVLFYVIFYLYVEPQNNRSTISA